MRHLLGIALLFTVLHTSAQTYVGGSGAILDLQTIDIPLTVSGLSPNVIDTINFGVEQVCLNITHTYLSDLTVNLIAPDGTTTELFSGIGGGGDDMQGTCLDQNAATTIASGSAPFIGTYQPMGQMGIVNSGQNPNGQWYLRITDNANADRSEEH